LSLRAHLGVSLSIWRATSTLTAQSITTAENAK
jgi:hypothetical protein